MEHVSIHDVLVAPNDKSIYAPYKSNATSHTTLRIASKLCAISKYLFPYYCFIDHADHNYSLPLMLKSGLQRSTFKKSSQILSNESGKMSCTTTGPHYPPTHMQQGFEHQQPLPPQGMVTVQQQRNLAVTMQPQIQIQPRHVEPASPHPTVQPIYLNSNMQTGIRLHRLIISQSDRTTADMQL